MTRWLLILIALEYFILLSSCKTLRQTADNDDKERGTIEKEDSYEILISRPDMKLKRQERKLLTLEENQSVLLKTTDTNKQYLWINGWLREFPDEITASVFKEQDAKLPTEISVLSSDLQGYPIGKVFNHMDTPSPVTEATEAPVSIPPTGQPVKSPIEIERTFNKFVREHKHKHIAADKRNYKIYYAIFAGRKRFMRIHLKYLDVLLQEGFIDEVHIWDFVQHVKMENDRYVYPESCTDSIFMENYVRNTEVSGYVLFKRPRLDWDRGDMTLKNGYLWGSFYTHYLENRRYKDNDIFIKGDDDIVFIDVAHFSKYTEGIASRAYNQSIHFPNIINNDVGFAIQAKRLDSQKMRDYYDEYERNGVNFEQRLSSFYDKPESGWESFDFNKVIPVSNWGTGTYTNVEFAKDIHNLFLHDPKRFITQSRGVHVSAPRFVPVSRRISINMFGGVFEAARLLLHDFIHAHCCDDEGFVGLWPSISGNVHIVDTAFTVSHLAFHDQKLKDDFNIQVKQYNQIADMLLKEYKILRQPSFENSLLSLSYSLKEGTVIRLYEGKTIYMIEHCKKRKFTSFKSFIDLGYNSTSILPLKRDYFFSIPDGPNLV